MEMETLWCGVVWELKDGNENVMVWGCMGAKGVGELNHLNSIKITTQSTSRVLLYNCPKVLHPPAQSPDMNPIENLWNKLDRRIRKYTITSISELKSKLQEEWHRIPAAYTASIVKTCQIG
ncbi:unnamed protein product [Euphydryas editha]|uniref:Tc1-like transposase DDE domain-containing protein n=1 Tax=Euphydryas editha TaxID=104508 RepID=A0AAU9TL09_EUPED|nr:unnamed protein product [Euphydryas editha]